MISQKQLEEQIVKELDTARVEKRVVVASWLVKSVLESWEQPGGVDSDRWILCAQKHIRTTVQKLVSRRAQKNREDDDQGILPGVLPGYDWVQTDYLVKRNGEQCIVPTLDLSEKEARGKLREFRAQIDGFTSHTNEFERFCDERWPAATGTA